MNIFVFLCLVYVVVHCATYSGHKHAFHAIKKSFPKNPKEEYRCYLCKGKKDCPAFNTGVLYPCYGFEVLE